MLETGLTGETDLGFGEIIGGHMRENKASSELLQTGISSLESSLEQC